MRNLVTLLLLAATAACADSSNGGGGLDAATLRALAVKASACTGAGLGLAAAVVTDVHKLRGATRAWYFGRLDCFRGAKNCREYAACDGIDLDKPCPFGNDVGRVSCTEGKFLQSCTPVLGAGGAGSRFVLEQEVCGPEGSGPFDVSCLPNRDGTALQCGQQVCTNDAEACAGTRFVRCRDGVATSQECADFGGVCLKDAPSEPPGRLLTGCFASGQRCTRDYCKGDVLVSCRSGLETSETKCSLVDDRFTCVAGVQGARCEAAPGDVECNPAVTQPVCVGAQAQVCSGGRRITFNCAAFNNAACVVDDGEAKCRATDRYAPIGR